MPRPIATVDEAIARFDDLIARYDHEPRGRRPAARPTARSMARRIANVSIALGIAIVATIAFGLFVGPIGIGGLFLVAMATMCILVFLSARPDPVPVVKPFTETMTNRDVVGRLSAYLRRERGALPAPAGQRVDAIGAQLPLLESRLGTLDVLDPIAQDARRLMGRHIPDLIDRYERVPVAHRHERDGGGLTVDERLLSGLDAAEEALNDLARRMTQDDRAALETQGRFIESRYKAQDTDTPSP